MVQLTQKGFYGWMLKTMAPKLGADKQAMEAAMRTSGLEWTDIRPPILTDGPATGLHEAKTGIVLKGMPQPSRSDVAAVVVAEVAHPRFENAAPIVYATVTSVVG